ncbi:hypothetical protein [Sorangium sp. So ce131]|uniref:hypothetical protein n=1 Tax=Sorangium sp. So ce131 TaxID=3133282 RepID=UPI003F5DDA26
MKALHLCFALACSLTAACGPSEASLCDAKCDCEGGCSDHQYDDCLNHYDDRLVDADRRGCLDRYDELLACEDDTWVCDDRKWDTSCKYEREELDRCMR